jgi:ornithine--oxo-acid transaminase
MIAIEFEPEAGGAKPFVKALAKKGLLCKETHTHTIRFAPPLVITKEEVDFALKVIGEVLG